MKRLTAFAIPSFLFMLLNFCTSTSHAQCDTFYNSDEANPVFTSNERVGSPGLDFVDINGDGLKDYYKAQDQQNIVLYHNTGNKTFPKYVKSALNGFEGATLPPVITTIQFRDFDGDGDFDCAMSDLDASFRPIAHILYYQNTGTKTAPHFENAGRLIDFASVNSPVIAFSFDDIDGDGDLDFNYTGFYDNTAHSFIHYTYLNTGTDAAPVYTLFDKRNSDNAITVDHYYDWNKDGLPDQFRGGSYYENTGTLSAPRYEYKTQGAPIFTNDGPFVFADQNSDGFLEVFGYSGNYSTQAPVAVIDSTMQKVGGRKIVRLESRYQKQGYTYKWRYNGILVPNYHKPYLPAPLPGMYVLEISSSCGTGLSLPYDTRVHKTNSNSRSEDLIVAGKASLLSGTIKTYPNPFVSEFTIQLPLAAPSTKTVVTISDLAGRVLLTESASSGTLQMGRTLQKGVYILQVRQAGKVVYQTKMLKE